MVDECKYGWHGPELPLVDKSIVQYKRFYRCVSMRPGYFFAFFAAFFAAFLLRGCFFST